MFSSAWAGDVYHSALVRKQKFIFSHSEAESLRSECQHGGFLMRSLFVAVGGHLLAVSSRGGEGEQVFGVSSYPSYQDTTPIPS